MEKQYAERDIEALEPHYSNHVSAMFVESLHSKSSIAAELAYRDVEIENLRSICADIPEGCTPADARHLREANHGLSDEISSLVKVLEEIAAVPGDQLHRCVDIALNTLDKY